MTWRTRSLMKDNGMRIFVSPEIHYNTFILYEIEGEITRQDTPMRKAVSARRRLGILLYYLSSTAEYRTIANRFGVSVAFVCSCIKEMSRVIVQKRKSKFITVPKGAELSEVMQMYKEKWQFPMCAGATDGIHIPIIAPALAAADHSDYVNRKGYHSIIMQAVWTPSTSSGMSWSRSLEVSTTLVYFPIQVFTREETKIRSLVVKSARIFSCDIKPLLLEDPAYPLLPWLIKGYPKNTYTSDVERHFNYMLSRARMTVKNTFERWKGRLQKFLKRVDMQVETLVNVVVASCILHNICELQGNLFLEDWQKQHTKNEKTLTFQSPSLAH